MGECGLRERFAAQHARNLLGAAIGIQNGHTAFGAGAIGTLGRALGHQQVMVGARGHLRQKAGGDWVRTTLTASTHGQPAIESAEHALALDEALTRLEQTDERAARVVELRYFAGLSPEQIAEVLGLARRTVDRDWRYARAFLHAALE